MRAPRRTSRTMPGQQRETTFRFLAQPADVNFGGKVHGGMVMKWIDQAGYAAAVGWSGQYCVTVAVGGIQFVKPILIGDIVVVRCKLIRTGSSSMHFALDAPDGRPAPVPPWVPQTDDDRILASYAEKIIAMSREQQAELERVRHDIDRGG